jgi:transketolase
VAAAQADDRIVGLTADLGKYTDMHIFAKEFPQRYFQMGMAEQLLFGAAAGMAETGLVPFASTYSVFATRRAYDFICLDIAEPGLNVNIVGGLPGLTTGYGPSHQATEDVAIFRGIPGLTIVDPCDSVDIAQAVPQLAACDGPTYLRLLRGQVPTVLDEYDYTFELGKAKVIRGGADVVFVSSGLMTMRALLAADELAKHRVVAEVDSDRLAVTLENHTVVGGLFETVAAAAVRRGVHRTITPVALPDEFLAAGALPTLHDRYGLSTRRIVTSVLERL